MGTTLTVIAERRILTSSGWFGVAVFHLGKCYEVMRELRRHARSTNLVDVKSIGGRAYVSGWPPDYGAREAYDHAKIASVDGTYWIDEEGLLTVSEIELEPLQAFAIAHKSVERCVMRFLCFEM